MTSGPPEPVGAGPTRIVHHADARVWLDAQPPGTFSRGSFITSLPDISELSSHTLESWKRWFMDAAAQVIRVCPDDGVAIFFQSDIKKGDAWIDKGYLVMRAAEEVGGVRLLWHRIACRNRPGTPTQGRATWSHLLCFSRSVSAALARPLPDVLPDMGEANWVRGMGDEVCRLACRYVRDNTGTRTIFDPYCGRGMVLAIANECGFDAVGVELSAKRARQAAAHRRTVPAP
ncbi:MAG: SAM-dependent methyltransferase [Myxococcaceae bacterium]|nr:SAM-dependent methyltransferase [Myxococcaceae bacterium]